MIDYFKGILSYKKTNVVVIEACGVGYSINITAYYLWEDFYKKLKEKGIKFYFTF